MMDMLEELVEQVGLCGVISMLADICEQKVKYIRSTRHDEEAAQSWEADARRLDRVYNKLDN